MSDKRFLVKFESNYADEFDIEGFMVMSEADWEEHKKLAARKFENFAKLPKDQYGRTITSYGERVNGIEIFFGTNEQMIYETLDCYLRSFSLTEISDAEYATLDKFFKGVRFGMLPMFEDDE